MALQARLKPWDGKTNLRRGITVRAIRLSFVEGKIVGPINEADAIVLRTIRQRDDDPGSALAFDICDEADMARLVSGETKQRLGLTPEVIEAVRAEVAAEQPAAKPTRRRGGTA